MLLLLLKCIWYIKEHIGAVFYSFAVAVVVVIITRVLLYDFRVFFSFSPLINYVCLVTHLFSQGYHGRGGHLTVETPQYESVLRKSFLQAGSYFGYDTIDVNGPTSTGM